MTGGTVSMNATAIASIASTHAGTIQVPVTALKANRSSHGASILVFPDGPSGRLSSIRLTSTTTAE